jgi:hypothetical protein
MYYLCNTLENVWISGSPSCPTFVIIFIRDTVLLLFLSEIATHFPSHKWSTCILYPVHKILKVRDIIHFKNFSFFCCYMQLKCTLLPLYNLVRSYHSSVSETCVTVPIFHKCSSVYAQFPANKGSDHHVTELILP